MSDLAGRFTERPWGYRLTSGEITSVLDQHDIVSRVDWTGAVVAWDVATITVDGVTRDASEWVTAPTTYGAMVEWLGY